MRVKMELDAMMENAMRIESERRARELEAATIAGFIGALRVALQIIETKEWYLPEHPYDFLESVIDEIKLLLDDPVSVKDKDYFND